MNTGVEAVPSTHGLLTTVAYQIGRTGAVHYALEGSVSHSGSTIQWLRDQLQIITAAPESETLARTTVHNDGMYFVPAFAGLFAPHWRSDARACLVGMTATHHKGHICRAALEAAAYQAREVFEAIVADSHVNLLSLNVDGGGTNNKLLMQFQADIINVPVVKPAVMETTAIGAAFAAGLAVGVWKDLDEIKSLWAVAETYQPSMDSLEREKYWLGWKKAVTRSLGWVEEEEIDTFVDAISAPLGLLNEEGCPDGDTVVDKKDSSTAAAGYVYSTLAFFVCTSVALGAGFLVGRHHRK
jgi:glycerol kinase